MTERTERFALVGILAAALAWHAATIDGQSWHVDEVTEINSARRSWSQAWSAPDSMPPLYPLLLKSWLTAAPADWSPRWLSAAFGLASILVAWRLGRELAGRSAAVACAALWAVNSTQIYYSQLTRGYALLTLWSATALWLLLRAVRNDRPAAWGAFAAVGVLGVFTHYYFPLLLGILGLYALVAWRQNRIGWGGPVGAALAMAVLAWPIVGCLQADFQFQKHLREPRSLTPAAWAYTYFSMFSGYSLGPSTNELQTMSPAAAAREAWPWGAAVAAPVGLLVAAGLHSRRRELDAWLLAAVAFLPPLAIGAVGAATGLTYNVRHVAWCAMPLTALAGLGAVALRPEGAARLALVVLAGICGLGAVARVQSPRYANEDFHAVAALLRADGRNGVAFVVPDYVREPLEFHDIGAIRAVALPDPDKVSVVVHDENDVAVALKTVGENRIRDQPCWVVYCRPFHGDPTGKLLAALKQELHLEPALDAAGVTLYRSRTAAVMRREAPSPRGR